MIISHSQNFEDVILWRALKHIDNGFYVDVGAQDPQIDSVSLLFYERGWRGVHVEPTKEYSKKLLAARSDEKVIRAAVSAQDGTIDFFEIEGSGLSTGDRKTAERHRANGWRIVETVVPTLRLRDLLDSCGNRDIHWLKIDVEGMEQEVIGTWSPSLSRPWIVLVESTQPMWATPTHAAWHKQLVGFGYRFAYFDGLNRFYISELHPELWESFGPGPNIFDDFALSGNGSAPFAAVLKAEIAGVRGELGHLQDALAAASADSARRTSEYHTALAASRKCISRQDERIAQLQERSQRQTAVLHRKSLAIQSLEKAHREAIEVHRLVVEDFRSPGAGMELSVGLWLARRLRPLGRLARAVSLGVPRKRVGAHRPGPAARGLDKARRRPSEKSAVQSHRVTDPILKPTREAATAWESILVKPPKAQRP